MLNAQALGWDPASHRGVDILARSFCAELLTEDEVQPSLRQLIRCRWIGCGLVDDIPVFVDNLNVYYNTQLPPTLVLECATVREIATRLVEKSMHWQMSSSRPPRRSWM